MVAGLFGAAFLLIVSLSGDGPALRTPEDGPAASPPVPSVTPTVFRFPSPPTPAPGYDSSYDQPLYTPTPLPISTENATHVLGVPLEESHIFIILRAEDPLDVYERIYIPLTYTRAQVEEALDLGPDDRVIASYPYRPARATPALFMEVPPATPTSQDPP